MTYEEAKRRLKDHFTIHSGGVVVSKIEIDRPHPKLDEAEKMMYEALEKQIPKKPKKETVQVNGYDHGCDDYCYTKELCPSCNLPISRVSYCPHCGQKILW
ncbi:MAG: hypothetical protein KBS59_00305 [Clostridiales bacterium]|nr:hypothetical protein [Clostridiales bacterium]